MTRTKDYVGKPMQVICSDCKEPMLTRMTDLNRTPKRTMCMKCEYERKYAKQRSKF
jgi:hypothetical protein